MPPPLAPPGLIVLQHTSDGLAKKVEGKTKKEQQGGMGIAKYMNEKLKKWEVLSF